MITKLLQLFKDAVTYAQNHPQLFFVLMLLIVMPLLFLYTGQQFLEVGKSNQDRLQKDRIGLMHDVVSSLLFATDFNEAIALEELRKISTLNPDIIDFKIVKSEGKDLIVVAAKHEETIGKVESETDLFLSSGFILEESIIFPFYENKNRHWAAYRAVESSGNERYFIYTLISLEKIDALFQSRENAAYVSLVFVYLFIIALALWHVKLTDYRYLYMKAQKASEMKDLFTNMIAHELRAPLTAIRGYASMIEDALQDGVEKEHSKRISLSAERLLGIVNDLLDVARIQSGKLSIVNEPTDVSSLVKKVISELEISAQQKNITLNSEGTEIAIEVSIDPRRLQQALLNLVSNAIKYTKRGVISLSVEDKFAFVEIRVKDTGMGISSDDQKKLFAPFFRVESEDVSKITGSGLGMWITKELIQLLGAKIAVESIKGVGTHIVITIPKEIRVS